MVMCNWYCKLLYLLRHMFDDETSDIGTPVGSQAIYFLALLQDVIHVLSYAACPKNPGDGSVSFEESWVGYGNVGILTRERDSPARW